MKQFDINDITQFSDTNEIRLATSGKYAKYDSNCYRLDIIKDICFIHTFIDGYEQTIEIPSHLPFSYTDENGFHTVKNNDDHIVVTGIASISFVTL